MHLIWKVVCTANKWYSDLAYLPEKYGFNIINSRLYQVTNLVTTKQARIYPRPAGRQSSSVKIFKTEREK